MKLIETLYNGYRFRSRLEARWAVFFDTLGIKYEYEGSPVVSVGYVEKVNIDTDAIMADDMGMYHAMPDDCVLIRC